MEALRERVYEKQEDSTKLWYNRIQGEWKHCENKEKLFLGGEHCPRLVILQRAMYKNKRETRC